MPDYCNEDDSKQTESVTMHGVHKIHPNDVGLDVASLKIIELSKKIRELNAALVSERNRCNNLCQVVRKLESESASLSNKDVICSLCKQNKITANEKIDNTSESAGQEKKIKKMESVVLELRQKVQTLNHDLLLAKKVVEAETGEIIPNINTWLTNLKLKTEGTYGTWRGRQQQITALKNRIAKLQSQLALKASSRTEVLINKDNIENETFSGATFFGINYFQDDDNNLDPQSSKVNHIIEQNENKTSTIIQLQDEKKRLEEDNDVTKKNLQKTKLRINNLLQEQKRIKTTNFIFNKKRKTDELVESLVHHNENLQNELNRMNQINKEKDDEIEKFNEQQSNLKQRKDIEIKRLEEIIIEKNQLIDNMNERLTTVNQIHLDKSEHEVITETNDIIQSNFIHSSQCDPDHIKSLTIERDGLVKLIENMESRIEELVNEKMKLELEKESTL
ncbi:LOW QUALITY PROTEIN: putative dna double-strand break repair rad50 ATPase [Schistosoma mansoni]|uniref:putative dna double-strand break repair rad50 ATPase n=1 Tax=Schistosoma mansoni TaxID=6183 RepID=UPI00022DCA3D|nr:LOW QUALITY PROTEIN: putative dna double-strand break repair rad50 ATPase [Schistosoma mansoni]|eukprot:XP_018654484.1 LOW QUALITY PROTEIN: putative dna double-strand break repair rad50 ATPase [Schistosoma mansoni]